MRVFISHSSKDKPAVEALAIALGAHGFEVWLDKWMIAPGDDVVAKINAGLEEASAGLIVFSAHARESRWVEAEVSYLTWARIQEGKVLIPIVAGDDAYVPPLLRPLARRGIEEIDAIADALFSRHAVPPTVARDLARRRERVTVSLRRAGDAIEVRVVLGGEEYGGASHAALPRDLESARDGFLRGFRSGHRRGVAEAVQQSLDASLAHLGRLLREFCFPGASAEALVGLLEGCRVGTVAEICFESDDPELLGLPFEALRLPDHRLLATLPHVVTLRRPIGVEAQEGAPLAGPIKVLTAVGAPDEGKTGSVLLDYEQELQNILDAMEVAQKRENVEVRILEIGHPDVIASAMARDAYHVLHLSCHGNPGSLELENEDGEAVPVTAQQLVDALRRAGQRLPLVFLNACHGGVEKGQTASFAESLLRAGVPCVLAMQTAVSDFYATELAREFYEHLARREPPLASHALAEARKELEKERLQRLQDGRAPLEQTQPEYATAALFVAGEEAPLADFSLEKEPLRERPVYEVFGPVPQLRIDELIGRRRELRETLRTLRDPRRRRAGVVLTGIGGVGKSAVAGRVMQRLKEDGWKLAAHVGRFDLSAIAAAVGAALIESDREESRKRAALLTRGDLDDGVRFQLLCGALAEDSLLLVLDDFEQNLVTGGGAFHDATVAFLFEQLLRNASRGRLLITCRYPVPRAGEWLREVPVGALSHAETRKLIQRLPALRERSTREIVDALRVIGGHPRVLELLDALLHGGEGRLPRVTKKLKELLEKESIDVRGGAPEERLQQAVLLGMRDVLLEQLVALARERGDDAALFQA
ncbi:MAG TPA: CHAT domain-containing protein, partial [Thermoanaerobaculia bacterium]|nr:CHAT domain-containing protein [Thermoanaerobaculia bacterium]